MRKNAYVLTIVGMIFLSSLITMPVLGYDNQPPSFGVPNPANESIDQPRVLDWSIEITDLEGDLFNWTIQCDNGQQNVSNSDINGTKILSLSALDYLTTYYVWVNATNFGSDITTREVYHFTTLDNQEPVSDFKNTTHGLKVDFNGTLSIDPDGTIENYTWYFGDGSKGYGNMTQHIFDDNLTYFVSLNVTDDGGRWDNKTIPITVKNAAPVANFTYKADLKNVSFDASSSYDIDGSIAKYAWNFGDGNTSSEMKPVHTYANEYTPYNVTLIVTDNKGNSTNISKLVTTNDTTPPTVKITKPERAFYIANKRIRRLFLRMAFVIGTITVEVNASDSGSGVERVEFYVNGKLKENKTTAPYTFNWTKDRLVRFIHIQSLKVVAYDKYGNTASDSMLVKKFL